MWDLMIKVEIDEEKLKEFIGKFVAENIESIAYKISMKEITELIQEEVRAIVPIIVQQELDKRKKRFWQK